MSKIKDLTGQKFGKLKVIKYYGSNKNGKALWLCQCDCENRKIVLGNSLSGGLTVSCGCYNRKLLKDKNTKHNMSNCKLYKVWQGMKMRCYNKNFIYYNNYGGRGIKVCKEWKNDFSAFYNWAINNGYKEGLTIDRIDNYGDYEPSNCRWLTRREQNNNMRKNILIRYNGEEQTISKWALQLNMSRNTIYLRIKRGWSIEKALTTPQKRQE